MRRHNGRGLGENVFWCIEHFAQLLEYFHVSPSVKSLQCLLHSPCFKFGDNLPSKQNEKFKTLKERHCISIKYKLHLFRKYSGCSV